MRVSRSAEEAAADIGDFGDVADFDGGFGGGDAFFVAEGNEDLAEAEFSGF